ncbi:hypothetical protein [Flavobacterium sp.]|uniref:hypothetical protein n=1 Tax=Flavobacterium sp. TaxID=239 RepID=UPI00286DCB3E|nr:hypothetical protein [Flavobacterium sp.]
MEKENTNSGFKAIIVVMTLLLLGSLGYIYNLINDAQYVEKILISEKDATLKDLFVARDSLNSAIYSNTSLSKELVVERNRVEKLIQEVKKAKNDISEITKFKGDSYKLKNNVAVLMKEVAILKKQNQLLKVERDSASVVIVKFKTKNDTLVMQNNNLTKKIEKASKLSLLNLEAFAIKQSSSGKQTVTEKASRADILKVSFMIAENTIAKSGDKNYYIQIIDSKNNVLGDKKTEIFGGKNLIYSFVKNIKYENKTLRISQDLMVNDIKQGNYYVNIYDKTELVSKTSFVLK